MYTFCVYITTYKFFKKIHRRQTLYLRHPLAVPHLSTFLEFIMHILILPGRLVKYPKVNSPYSVCLLSSLHNLQNATPMVILQTQMYIIYVYTVFYIFTTVQYYVLCVARGNGYSIWILHIVLWICLLIVQISYNATAIRPATIRRRWHRCHFGGGGGREIGKQLVNLTV